MCSIFSLAFWILASLLRKPCMKYVQDWFHLISFISHLIYLSHFVCSWGFKRDSSLKYYTCPFHTVLASTVQTHVPVPVIMRYCRHLSSLLVEGQALWCSLVSVPVSGEQTSHRKVVWAAAMRDCDVSQPVYTMTVVTPCRSCFCQGALTRSSLSLRQGSPLHLTPVLTRAVMSTTPPITCLAVSLRCPPSLAGGMPRCHASGQRVWKSRWVDVF